MRHFAVPILAITFAAACEPMPQADGTEAASAPVTRTCQAQARGQTRIEIVEETVEVAPERRDLAGRLVSAAVFRTRAAPREVEVAPGEAFDAICQDDLTTGFVASLQRALQARNLYSGPIDGVYSAATAAAVGQLQQTRGLDSPVLSADLARALGLIAVDLAG